MSSGNIIISGLCAVSFIMLVVGCMSGAVYEDMAPSEIAASIEGGATDVLPDSSFTVTFMKPIDTSTITGSTFFLATVDASASLSKESYNESSCNPANAVSGTVSCSSALTCTFTPDAELNSETEYVLCVTEDILYADGNSYPGSMVVFTTKDVVSPDTTISSGPSGSTKSNDATFEFSSSESGGTFECSLNEADYAVCSSPVAYEGIVDGSHTFSVRAIDDSDNSDISPASRTWTIDTTSPAIASVSPASASTGAAINSTVSILFSEEMDSSTINSATFTLAVNNTLVSGSISYNESAKTAVFTPNSSLSSYTTYTAALSADAKDAVGNAIASGYGWSFATSDVVAPSVNSVSPLSAAVAVSLTTNITATFSEAMDSSTITSSTFTVTSASGAVAGTVTYDTQSKTATFNPDSNLDSATIYTATVTTGAKDSAGNGISSLYSWTFNTDAIGTLDTSFDGDGIVVSVNAAGGTGNDAGYRIVFDSSGRILTSGYSGNASSNLSMIIWRYNSDGTLDTTLGGSGFATHDGAAGGTGDDYGNRIILDSSGRILVAGYSRNASGNDDMTIWRYNSDGTLDTTFNGSGFATHNNAAGGNSHDYGFGLTLDSSGRILVSGYSRNASGNDDMTIWRYNSDGTLDTTLGGSGFVTHNGAAGGNGHDYASGIILDSSGRILVVGNSINASNNYDMVILRYNSDGTLDTTFDSDGIVSHAGAAGGTNGADAGNSIKLDSSGRILVTGQSVNSSNNRDIVVWRYNSDGTLDTTFDSDGYVVSVNPAGGTGNDFGTGIILDSSGRILAAGYSRNASGNDDIATLRYNSDGTLDTTFGSNGIAIHNSAAGGNGNDLAWGVNLDSSGRILIVGRSRNASGNDDMVIWRYK